MNAFASVLGELLLKLIKPNPRVCVGLIVVGATLFFVAPWIVEQLSE